MYIIKNAFINLFRNRGRNVMMGIIIFIVIVLSGTSIIIHSTAKAIIEDYKNRFGSEVSLNVIENQKKDVIEPDKLLAFGDSKYLLNKLYIAKIAYVPKNLIAVNDDGSLKQNNSDYLTPKGYLISTSRDNINDDFKNGIKIIVSGKMFENDNEVLISKTFAELNQLNVDDQIELSSISPDEALTVKLKVSGIYEDISVKASNAGLALNDSDNEIYTSFTTLTSSALYQQHGLLEATFYLKKPQFLNQFKEELIAKGLPANYDVSTDEKGYEQIMKPVQSLANMSSLFTISSLVIGSILIILLSMYAIRERKYEVGVLRAMGMKKKSVAIGLISEMVIITLICLLLGLAATSLSSKYANELLLKQQIEISEQLKEDTSLNKVEAKLDVNTAGNIVGVSILLGVISTIGTIIYITRFEPRKILSERN